MTAGLSQRAFRRLFVLSSLVFLVSCRANQISEDIQQAAHRAGVIEADQRSSMLEGTRVLPPPKEFRAVQKPKPSESEREKKGIEDATSVLLTRLIERQQELEQKHAEVETHLKEANAHLKNLREDIARETAFAIKQQLLEVNERMERLEVVLRERNKREAETPPVKVAEPPKAKPEPAPEPAPEPEAAPALPKPGDLAGLESAKTPRLAKLFTPDAQRLRAQAREAYRKIVTQFPDSEKAIEARLGLGQLALEDADTNEALIQFERILTDFPESEAASGALLEAGRLRRELKDYPTALQHFLAFADRYPRDRRTPIALLEAAETQEASGNLDSALSSFKDASNRFGDTTVGLRALLRYGDTLVKQGKHAEGREAYAKVAAARNPATDLPVEAQIQAARSWIAEKKAAEARAVLQNVLSGRTSDDLRGEAAFLIAETYDMEGDNLDAGRAYNAAADEFPGHARALDSRQRAGERMAAAGLPERAGAHFRKIVESLEAKPADVRRAYGPPAMLGLARALDRMNKEPEAQAVLSEMRQTWPQHPLTSQADLLEADILIGKNLKPQAMLLLDRVIEHRPGTPEAMRALTRKAELENQASNTDGALKTHALLRKTYSPAETAEGDFKMAMQLLGGGTLEQAGKMFVRMAGDPLVPESIRRQSAYYVPVVLEREGKRAEALAGYRAFLKQYGKTEGDEAWTELVDNAKWKERTLAAFQANTAKTAEPTHEKKTP
ncbi:MAG: tetratricopeptide repeat protein [Planctomycetota bacterium]|nr:tetratricopeptide repeat protein [Planctomycetota bacterium]